ncbi:MAG: redoxin domain-containing protein [Sphingobacteriales bacterium]
MKNLKLLFTLPGILAIQVAFAQTNVHLKLSDQYPAAGEKIVLTYDPTGTPLDGKKDISVVAIFLDNKDYPSVDIDMKTEGKLLMGEASIPATAKAFMIRVSAGDDVDDNGEKGYVYLLYKDKQPVPGAYATQANFMTNGMANYLGKIKTDTRDALELYKKEFTLYPESEKEYQSNYYPLIARNSIYSTVFNAKVSALEKSSNEDDMLLAEDLLEASRNNKAADSLQAVIRAKFPVGTFAKNEIGTAFYKEKDPAKKDSIYKMLIKKYPAITNDAKQVDRFNLLMAEAYLQKKDMEGYNKYDSRLKNKASLPGYLNNIAWQWAETGKHLPEAEKLAKEAIDILDAQIAHPVGSAFASPKMEKGYAEGSYNAIADTYAYILWKENKSAEALPYMKTVYDRTNNELNSTEHYAEILAGTGQYTKAMEIIDKGIKDGQSSAVLADELKKDYIKVKGSDNGYSQYLASLEKIAKAKIMADLAKTMINMPAPTFALKDIDGNTVSLADLKGKVVIVDFWATWCGPCKASFPGMQLAVNKYKDNPNVKFLFVDCWETVQNYADGVKKFITDNKYTFHVLLDEKGDDGRQAKVVTSYKVDGIPTKFIIDKSGNIRFKYVGYSGSADKVLDEVSNMIELTGNPEMANTATTPATKGR